MPPAPSTCAAAPALKAPSRNRVHMAGLLITRTVSCCSSRHRTTASRSGSISAWHNQAPFFLGYFLVIVVAHFGQVFWLQGFPVIWGISWPHPGHTQRPLGPPAKGPPIRPCSRPPPRGGPVPSPLGIQNSFPSFVWQSTHKL